MRHGGRQARPEIDRFLEKVEKTESGCWLWTAALSPEGYALFVESSQRLVRGHRWAYEHFVGPIPPLAVVRPGCGVRNCVNHEHAKLVTRPNHEATAALTPEQVREIRRLYRPGRRFPRARVAQRFGITPGAAFRIATGERRADVVD